MYQCEKTMVQQVLNHFEMGKEPMRLGQMAKIYIYEVPGHQLAFDSHSTVNIKEKKQQKQ